MVSVELSTNTLAMLVAGLYCAEHEIDSIAIPYSIWISIAEKLEYFLPVWDYDKISFEQFINTCIFIYPKEAISEADLKDMQKNTLYWEYPNGNIILIVSMDVSVINVESV